MRKFFMPVYILLFLILGSEAGAQVFSDSLEIKLVTIDPGDELTTWWGHTGLIVEDQLTGQSLFYNYGLFSFEQDNFLTNFARGRLIFWVGVWHTELALRFYKSQNRTIRIQVLDLPVSRKQEMAAFLAKNVRPENREYLYDHYYDNCATRIRDIFDRDTEGQFHKFTSGPSQFTLRGLTRRFTHRNFLMDWLLMFLMNDTIDQPIRQWDDMFLPTELEKYIGMFSYVDTINRTCKMVKDTSVYYEAVNAYQVPDTPPVHWPKGLLIGTMTGIIGIGMAIGISKNKRAAWIFYGMYLFLLGIWFGIPGTVLFFMSILTDHVVTYYNENLFLANPLTFLFIPAGIGLIFKHRGAIRYTPVLIYLTTGIALLLMPLKILHSFDQDNLLSIMLILPPLLLNALAWWRIINSEPSV